MALANVMTQMRLVQGRILFCRIRELWVQEQSVNFLSFFLSDCIVPSCWHPLQPTILRVNQFPNNNMKQVRQSRIEKSKINKREGFPWCEKGVHCISEAFLRGCSFMQAVPKIEGDAQTDQICVALQLRPAPTQVGWKALCNSIGYIKK